MGRWFGELTWACAALVILFVPSFGMAQNIRPSTEDVARFLVSTGTSVEVYRSAQSTVEQRNNIYFHRPAFLFLEREETSLQDWPSIIHEVEELPGGGTAIVLQIVSSTPGIRQMATDEVLLPAPRGDSGWLDSQEVDRSTVAVRPWPVTAVRLRVADRDNPGATLAAVEHTLTEEEKDSGIWRLRLELQEDNASTLQAVLQGGDAIFEFDYSYTGIAEQSGVATRSYQIEAINAAESIMTSEQRAGNAPLFQDEVANVVAQISESTLTVVRATDAEIIDHLSIDWEETLFQEASNLSELDDNPELLERASSYLERLVDTIETENEQSTTTTDETTDTTRLKVAGGWEDGWEASGEVEVTREQLQRLVVEHGITITENENVAVASDIQVSFLRNTWRLGVQRAATFAFISVPGESGFEAAGIVGQARIVSSEEIGIIEVDRGPFVPPGAALCYFGAGTEPPTGYTWLHPDNSWPRAPALFGHLAGNPMPDARNAFLLNTDNPAMVGTVHFGTLSLPSSSVSVSTNDGQISISRGITIFTIQPTVASPGGTIPFDHAAWRPNSRLAEDFAIALWSPTNLISNGMGGMRTTLSPNAHARISPLQVVTAISADIPISGFAIPLNEVSTYPRHVGCRWMVRTR